MQNKIIALVIASFIGFGSFSGINKHEVAFKLSMLCQDNPAIPCPDIVEYCREALKRGQECYLIDTPLADHSLFYRDQSNSKGEMHPRIRTGEGSRAFVTNNCDAATAGIYDQIVTYAESKGVRPSIVFAIAWADTQCGHALTTPNNYGNTGNNDRGQRAGFFTPLEGWKAIVNTLNNQYMGQTTALGHLSGGGRDELQAEHGCATAPMGWRCWATSPENWNTNAKRALSVMEGREITAAYPFRTR